MFLDRLREYQKLCVHSDTSFSVSPSPGGSDELVLCRECGHTVSVRDFLCRDISSLVSPTFAHEYAKWTGRVDVPCIFNIKSLNNRVVPRDVPTNFSTLYRGFKLLRAIHSPFVRGENEKVDPKIFEHLLKEYLGLVDRISSECEREPQNSVGTGGREEVITVKTILQNMKNAFANVDMYDQYFRTLAPYVKYAHFRTSRQVGEKKKKKISYSSEEYGRVFEDREKGDEPFSALLEHELQRSSFVHRHFSPYCIPFEVIHVMVLSFLFGNDVDAVYNLVLDMAAKLCCGFYSFPISRTFETGLEIRQFLDNCITPTKNLKLYYHVRKYRKGGSELADSFSEEFLKEYGRLESEIRKRFPRADEDTGDRIEKFIYQQTFPYMLFEQTDGSDDDSAYYAFVVALAHYVSKSNPNMANSNADGVVPLSGSSGARSASVPKGVVSECKKLFKFVKECISRVKDFDKGETLNVKAGKERQMYWTKEVFNLFLVTYGEFGKNFVEIIGSLIYAS